MVRIQSIYSCRRLKACASTYLAVLVVNHDVVRLDISVHDALAVAEVQGLEQLEDVEANVEIVELGV